MKKPLLFILCGAIFTMLCTPSSAQSKDKNWTYGIVYATHNGQHRYLGMVSQPELPILGSTSVARTVTTTHRKTKASHDYEIWLVRPGSTQSLWYSAEQEAFGSLSATQDSPRFIDSEHRLRTLIQKARPVQPLSQPNSMSVAHSIGISTPDSLKEMASKSDYIVTASVIGILWNERVPIGSPKLYQHTVYLLNVDRSLGAKQAPIVLKLCQVGGTQPSLEDNSARGGLRMAEDPLLTIGQRYLLFLREMEDPTHFFKKLGYVQGSSEGITGKMADLDEMLIVNPLMGKTGIQNGILKPIDGSKEWRFANGNQLVNLSESEAIAAIQEALKP